MHPSCPDFDQTPLPGLLVFAPTCRNIYAICSRARCGWHCSHGLWRHCRAYAECSYGQLAAEVIVRYGIVTGRLEVGFKRRLNTPRVVLATACVRNDREEAEQRNTGVEKKRKLEITGKVERHGRCLFRRQKRVRRIATKVMTV